MEIGNSSSGFLNFLKKRISIIESTPERNHGGLEKLLLSLYHSQSYESDNYHVSSSQETSLQIYVESKENFLTKKNMLVGLIEGDMRDREASAGEIFQISEVLGVFHESLEIVSDALIRLMALDPTEARAFPNPSLYIDTLFEENFFLESETIQMRMVIGKWMEIHKEEIKEEHEKFQKLQETGELGSLLQLLKTTGKLSEVASDSTMKELG